MAIENASAKNKNAIKGRDVIKEYNFFISLRNLVGSRPDSNRKKTEVLRRAENSSYLEQFKKRNKTKDPFIIF
jgi:hypothetical protein